jgi:hypothetical protein
MERTVYLSQSNLWTYAFNVPFSLQIHTTSNLNVNATDSDIWEYDWIDDANHSSDFMDDVEDLFTLSVAHAKVVSYWVVDYDLGVFFLIDELKQVYDDTTIRLEEQDADGDNEFTLTLFVHTHQVLSLRNQNELSDAVGRMMAGLSGRYIEHTDSPTVLIPQFMTPRFLYIDIPTTYMQYLTDLQAEVQQQSRMLQTQLGTASIGSLLIQKQQQGTAIHAHAVAGHMLLGCLERIIAKLEDHSLQWQSQSSDLRKAADLIQHAEWLLSSMRLQHAGERAERIRQCMHRLHTAFSILCGITLIKM